MRDPAFENFPARLGGMGKMFQELQARSSKGLGV